KRIVALVLRKADLVENRREIPKVLYSGTRGHNRLLKKRYGTVILSPSPVILSEAKDLCISLRINSAKNLLPKSLQEHTRFLLRYAQSLP
ncbi:MAG: hypothetical protein ACRD1O_10010, partial [Terriglobia bacterium]